MTEQDKKKYYEALEVAVKPPEWSYINEETSTEVYFKKDEENVLTIAFKDSRDKLDWKYNFMFWPTAYRILGIRFFAHTGFLKCFLSVLPQIRKEITEKIHTIKLRGHSKGSALAMLAHQWLWYNYPSIALNTIIFGTPKVFLIFQRAKLQLMTHDIERVNQHFDLVSKIPPFFLFGYSHYGKETKIGQSSWKEFFQFLRNPGRYHWYEVYLRLLISTRS